MGATQEWRSFLDLAGLCKHVTVLEFLPEPKADKVLQDRGRQN